ncbi:hypothetical protein OPQ81_006689 [Rhizoctonia solani]|nr:hypothetical protein OPQ81_006689 [Rhizoctonia solani]
MQGVGLLRSSIGVLHSLRATGTLYTKPNSARLCVRSSELAVLGLVLHTNRSVLVVVKALAEEALLGEDTKDKRREVATANPKAGFEGGQTPISRRFPKRGFFNQTGKTWAPVNLERIQNWIDQGRLTSSPTHPITARELLLSGCIHDVHDGVKVLGDGAEFLKTPVHIEPSRASQSAIKAIEALGGSVKCTYYNPLALRDLVKGRTDRKRAAPTRKSDIEWYSSWKNRGYLATPQTAEEVKAAKKAMFEGPGPRVRVSTDIVNA